MKNRIVIQSHNPYEWFLCCKLLQIANHTGYIQVDWKRVERDVNKAKKQLKLNTEKPTKEVRTKIDEVRGALNIQYNQCISIMNVFSESKQL